MECKEDNYMFLFSPNPIYNNEICGLESQIRIPTKPNLFSHFILQNFTADFCPDFLQSLFGLPSSPEPGRTTGSDEPEQDPVFGPTSRTIEPEKSPRLGSVINERGFNGKREFYHYTLILNDKTQWAKKKDPPGCKRNSLSFSLKKIREFFVSGRLSFDRTKKKTCASFIAN